MLDPDAKDDVGMPLTARCVSLDRQLSYFRGSISTFLSVAYSVTINPLMPHLHVRAAGVYHWP